MQILVYADESGTGGVQQGKDPVPTVYGFIGTSDYWTVFDVEWQSLLDDFKVPYFHFSELEKAARQKPKNQFRIWSDKKVDDFIHAAALVAGRLAAPCGSSVTLKGEARPFEKAVGIFFKDCMRAVHRHWPHLTGKVNFFFEYSNEEYCNLIKGVADKFRTRDSRIGTPEFPRWDNRRHCLRLQAADLLAYSQRQNAQILFENRGPRNYRILDLALLRNVFPIGHPKRQCRLSDRDRVKLINEFRKDKERKDWVRIIQGEKPQEYFPLVEVKRQRINRKLPLKLTMGH